MSKLKNHRIAAIAACLNIVLVGVIIYLSLEIVELKNVPQVIENDSTQYVITDPATKVRPFDFTVDFYGMKYQGNSENILDNQVLYIGAYEKDILYFMRDVMLNSGARNSIFVDIGANIGQHSLFMSNYAAEVHAFEPYQPVLEKFNNLIELNSIENIVTHPVGLGDKEEKITFYEPPPDNLGVGTFVEANHEDKSLGSELQIVTGDAALSNVDINKINLIKIDIEGYEKPALKGLRNTLETARPFVVVEVSIDPEVDTFFNSMRELKASFPEDYGLVAFVSDMQNIIDGNYKFNSFNPDFNLKQQFNLMAYPKERLNVPRLE